MTKSSIQNTKLKIYNSLKGEKEVFEPLNPEAVGMYVCGPTVYSNVHLGNARTFTSFDVVYRYFKFLGFKVRYVRNITDVGHLLDNEEDKISKRARIEQLEPMEIVQKYTVDFHNVMQRLNAHPPSIEPTATGHIVEQIEIIQDLINKRLAYEQNGSVYFDVHAYNENENYGELSGRKIEDLLQETRLLDGQTEKKNPQDFALWKKAQPEHIMRWSSPWGVGYPGWHLECTVMSTKYLGKTFDIHGGGMDLKFPHHECEIAQAKGSHGKAPANYWMHTNMLTLNGQKMSKSTGNSILPQEFFSGDNSFFSKAFSPMVLRFFMLQAHYRSVLDLSNEAVEASEKGFNRLVSALELLEDLNVSQESSYDFTAWDQRCCNAMNDDFNTPILIAELFEAVKIINQISQKKASISKPDKELLVNRFYAWFYEVLGLKNEKSQDDSKLDAAMQILIGIRNQARVDKNWELSDQVRDALATAGILLKDGPDGTNFTLK